MNLRLLLPLVALLLVTPVSPAAAGDEIGLSPDGLRWGSHLPAPLFDDAVRWVPGDVRTASFHVRNQGGTAADLAIAVETVGVDGLLEKGHIALSARSGSGDWVGLHQVGRGIAIDDHAVGAGETTRVQVRASLDPASTNESQSEQVMLRFRLVLTDASAAAGGSDGQVPDQGQNLSQGQGQGLSQGQGKGGGLLPETGAPVIGWLLLIAAGLVGTGAALVRSRRREVHG